MGEESNPAQLIRTYVCLAVYVALSTIQIFFNKWILSSPTFNFPYPVALTLLHMLFSSVLCFLVIRVFKIIKLQPGMTYELYLQSVVPISVTFAMTLWLGNTAYMYISVAFAQMLKAIMPVAVFILGAAVGLEPLSIRMFGIMSLISGGVVVASYGEVEFHWIGVIYQLGGVIGEAARLILTEILLKRRGLKLDPLTMMYYVSPCSAVCLFIPWLLLEQPQMSNGLPLEFDFVIMTLNALCTFALNVSVFLVIIYSSALTARVAGVVKDWLVVLLSAAIFADTKLTSINLVGYAVAITGVVMYNRLKLQSPARLAEGNVMKDTKPLLDTETGPSQLDR